MFDSSRTSCNMQIVARKAVLFAKLYLRDSKQLTQFVCVTDLLNYWVSLCMVSKSCQFWKVKISHSFWPKDYRQTVFFKHWKLKFTITKRFEWLFLDTSFCILISWLHNFMCEYDLTTYYECQQSKCRYDKLFTI